MNPVALFNQQAVIPVDPAPEHQPFQPVEKFHRYFKFTDNFYFLCGIKKFHFLDFRALANAAAAFSWFGLNLRHVSHASIALAM
jgi:hypothetical protein